MCLPSLHICSGAVAVITRETSSTRQLKELYESVTSVVVVISLQFREYYIYPIYVNYSGSFDYSTSVSVQLTNSRP